MTVLSRVAPEANNDRARGQVHYHGYMGTTGAPWIQGYVADRWIAPPEHAPYFSEKLLQVPQKIPTKS